MKYLLILFTVIAFGQASNQMVTFTQAASLGFTLQSGQSHVTSNQCMTKSDALAKYVLSTTPMEPYSSNQLVPRNTWSTAATAYSFIFGNNNFETSASACSGGNTGMTLYSPSATLVVNSKLYYDSQMTEVVDEVEMGGNWYKSGNTTYRIQGYYSPPGNDPNVVPDYNPKIAEIVQCSTAPSPATNLVQTGRSTSSISFEWTAGANATSYYVYLDGTNIATTSATSFTVSGLQTNQFYAVRIVAVNGSEQAASTAIVNMNTENTQGSGGSTNPPTDGGFTPPSFY
jgi:hypothetical protein